MEKNLKNNIYITYIYIWITLLKLTQYCKSTILQFFKKGKKIHQNEDKIKTFLDEGKLRKCVTSVHAFKEMLKKDLHLEWKH